MQRFGRVLRLREGAEEEYERYHTEVWPEVLSAVGESGIRNYTIFRYGRWLFSYFELPDGVSLDDVGMDVESRPECCRWEDLMHKLQEPLPESGETLWWVPMKEIFHCPGSEPTIAPPAPRRSETEGEL